MSYTYNLKQKREEDWNTWDLNKTTRKWSKTENFVSVSSKPEIV